METKASEAPSNRVYEDFEPYCKWRTDEGQEILEIDLKGFRKEQLRVHAKDKGMLIISGERPLNATKWCRFHKETKLTKDCDPKQVRAKFSQGNGFLSIVMPKKLQLPPRENVHDTKLPAQKTKDTVWGVKIDTRRIVPVAAVVVAVVFVVAVSRLLYVYRHPHDSVKEHIHV